MFHLILKTKSLVQSLSRELNSEAREMLQQGNPTVISEVIRKIAAIKLVSKDFMEVNDADWMAWDTTDRARTLDKIRELEEGLAAAKDVVRTQLATVTVCVVCTLVFLKK